MWRGFIENLLELLYPATCVACGKGLKKASCTNKLVCAQCWGGFKKNIPPFCRSCGRHLENKQFSARICPTCVKNNFYFDRAFSPCVYEGAIKSLIHAFKYAGKDYLGETLSEPMISFIKEYDIPIDYIDLVVPLPLSKTKMREREFNQAELLATHVAKAFDKRISDDILIKKRDCATQTSLTPMMRFDNVRGSFSVTDPHATRGKYILLVDDVLTTGATTSEAARTLKQAGAGLVFVLTLAN